MELLFCFVLFFSDDNLRIDLGFINMGINKESIEINRKVI